MSYILVCLIIGLALLIHETGHFIMARMAKIPVERFSIGFGPRLWGFRKGDTEFCISLIPLGGYVLPKLETEDEFFRISPSKRVFFSLGGPLANLLSVIPVMAVFNVTTNGLSIAGIFFHPFLQTVAYIGKIISSLPLLFQQPQNISGVVGIVSQGSQIVGSAAGTFTLFAFLSVNFAVLNLLPIPALDGGQILMTFLEKISPKWNKARMPLSLLGWLFLIFVMGYATSRDIFRLFG